MRYRLRTLLQFRLGTLLVAISLIGLWLGLQVNRANRQKRAVAAVRAARGVVQYDFEQARSSGKTLPAESAGRRWLRNRLGDDYFHRVTVVTFATEFYGRRQELGLSKVNDEGLRVLESLPHVENLELGNNRAVTDVGLVHLRNLTRLKVLYLFDCNVTGCGSWHLSRLPNLKTLEMRYCPVDHDGLVELAKLRGLTYLGLADTSVTDDDLVPLKELTNLQELRLSQTRVTDAGLTHLRPLVSLQRLALPAAVSDHGFSELQAALPHCQIVRDPKPPRGTASQDGLSFTATLEKKTYRIVDEITLSFTLKNDSDRVIFIGDGLFGPTYQIVGDSAHFEMHLTDENNSRLRFGSDAVTEGTGALIRRVFRLAPGESYPGSIYIVARGEREVSVNGFPRRSQSGTVVDVATGRRHVLGKDGHNYTLSLIYQVNPETHGVYQPPQDFKDELLWKGKMATTPLQFTIE